MNMSKNIYVTMPTLAPLEEVDAYLRQVWESGVMTHNGPLLRKFEHDVAEWHGMQHHTVVVNGTIALQSCQIGRCIERIMTSS